MSDGLPTNLACLQHAVTGVAQGIASIVKSYCGALVAGKAQPALNELCEFARFMECRYGRADDRDEQSLLKEIQHELNKVAVWDSNTRPPSQN